MTSLRSLDSDRSVAAPELNLADYPLCGPNGERELTQQQVVSLFFHMDDRIEELSKLYPHIFSKGFPTDPSHIIYQRAVAAARYLVKLQKDISFDSAEYLAFWTICQQTVGENIMTESWFALARSAFIRAYGNVDALEVYMKHIATQLFEWSAPENLYYALFHSVINGSMMGKTRLLTEFAKRMCLQFYLNVSKSGDVYPCPSKTIRDWISRHCDPKVPRAYLNTQSLILGCASMLEEWLQDQKGQFNSHTEVFEAWYKKQDILHEAGSNAFWEEVLRHQKTAASRLEVHARIKGIIRLGGLSPEIKKNYSEIASSLLQGPGLNPDIAPIGIDPVLWKRSAPGLNIFWEGLILSYPRLLASITRKIDDLLWSPGFTISSEFVKLREACLADWGFQSYCWPTLMIVLDEARALLPPVGSDSTSSIFEVWRHAARFAPKQSPSLVLVVTDTNSRISILAPTEDLGPSSRACHVDSEYSGRKLFAPFYRIRSIDAFAVEPQFLREVLKLSGYAQYGRAALSAFIQRRRSSGSELMNLLKRKLVKVRSGTEFDDSAAVAILYFLICFSVQSFSPLAQELVESNMMRCCGISESSYQIVAVAEPAMAMAARQVLQITGWGPLVQRVCQRGITNIDVGA